MSRIYLNKLFISLLLSTVLPGISGLHATTALQSPATCGSMAYYIVHNSGELALDFTVNRPSAELGNNGGIRLPQAVFWQFYDAEEHLVTQQYHQFSDSEDLTRTFSIPAAERPAGIYQLRYAFSPGNGLTAELTTEPDAPVGVMPCRSRMSNIPEAWLFVPPATKTIDLSTYACNVIVLDEDGTVIGSSEKGKQVTVPPESLIRISVSPPHGQFGIKGLSPILCPDAISARTIAGSLEEAADGKMYPHKFQVRMQKWMHALTPADLAVEAVDLEPLANEWLKDPRNAGLLGISGPFNHIPRILKDQILDPDSPEYGLGTNTSWLGPAYLIDAPFNPYRRNPAILNRILLQEFAKYLKMAENGTFDANNWNHYAGVDGLGFRQRSYQFGTIAPYLPEDLRRLWFEAASRVMNTMGLRRVSCENQTSHWLLDHYMIYLGSGRSLYKTIAHDFAVALASPELNTFMQTGYQQEGYGPDATYQGLCAAQQAIYYRFSRDSVTRDGLQRVYDLFNHTVAPEPDGKLYGASNFSHRTQGSWVNKQYNAGVRLMAPELPEAAVWYQPFSSEDAEKKAYENIRKGLKNHWDDVWYEKNMRWLSTYAYHPWLAYFGQYLFPMTSIPDATWPALSETPFTKNVNNEFVFAKRPTYYAAVYNGRTSHGWTRARAKTARLPQEWEERNGKLVPTTAGSKKNKWCSSQGLSLFWTPQFGNLILGKNWNVYVAQMTRADFSDGSVAWPDYWSLESTISPDGTTITQDLKLFDQPMHVHREIQLTENAVNLTVTVSPEGEFEAKRLVEQFPILLKEDLHISFATEKGWTDETAPPVIEPVHAIRFLNGKTAATVDLRLINPAIVRLGPVSHNCGQDIQTLEIRFPTHSGDGILLPLKISLKSTIPERP